MFYLILSLISLIMGFKIGNMYHVLMITTIKKDINNQNIEDTLKKKYEKENYKLSLYIEKLENEINELKGAEIL